MLCCCSSCSSVLMFTKGQSHLSLFLPLLLNLSFSLSPPPFLSLLTAGNEKHISKMKSTHWTPDLMFVSQVVARDDDQGANGQLSYMLSGGNDEGVFSLSSSGQLSVTHTLDREARGKYVLLITATDSGKNPAEFGTGPAGLGPVLVCGSCCCHHYLNTPKSGSVVFHMIGHSLGDASSCYRTQT